MNSNHFWALLLGASVLGVSANAQQAGEHTAASAATAATANKTGGAVTKGVVVADSVRTADLQPLRFETSWGSANIIRGADGPVVGTVGWFRDFDVARLVESSPHAVAEARRFQTNNFRGSLVSTLGATTVAIGIVVSANSSNNAASPIL